MFLFVLALSCGFVLLSLFVFFFTSFQFRFVSIFYLFGSVLLSAWLCFAACSSFSAFTLSCLTSSYSALIRLRLVNFCRFVDLICFVVLICFLLFSLLWGKSSVAMKQNKHKTHDKPCKEKTGKSSHFSSKCWARY